MQPRINQRGIALIVVLSVILFVVVLIQETVFETQVEYRTAISELDSLKAYHAARAGIQISILRVKIYRMLQESLGDQIKPYQSYDKIIWQFPFSWPLLVPEGIGAISKEELDETNQESFMKSQFSTSIEPENGRVNLNDLSSPIPSLRKWTFQVLFRLIILLRDKNEVLKEEMSDNDIAKLVRNIKDWIDPDTIVEGSTLSESSLYDNTEKKRIYPFLSLEEIHQVQGMSEELYKELKPFIALYGEMGVNINTASVEVLQALHPEFPLKLAEEIRELTINMVEPFIFTKDSFIQFLNEKGAYYLVEDLQLKKQSDTEEQDGQSVSNNTDNISYVFFDAPYNFRLSSTGRQGLSEYTISAVYFDKIASFNRVEKLLLEEIKRQKNKIKENLEQIRDSSVQSRRGDKPTKEDPPSNIRRQAPKQPPYRFEIIYWKETI